LADALFISSSDSPQHDRIKRLLAFYGVNCVSVDGNNLSEIVAQLNSLSVSGQRLCVLASGEALGDLMVREPNPAASLEAFARIGMSLFAFGFEQGRPSEVFLKAISGELVKSGSLGENRDLVYEVLSNYPEITAELSGHAFKAARRDGEGCFAGEFDRHHIETLIKVNQEPFLCSVKVNRAKFFLSAGCEIVDLDEPADDGFSFAEYFSRLIPLLVFLKNTLGDEMWHSPNHSVANLIIDDPLLRPRYGFVDFESLVRKADEIDFTTTLAFIPWNHRRTNRGTVDLFRQRPDRLSICIHGCDHISAEFAMTDPGNLNSMIQTSLSRIKDLEKATGLPVEKSMVFPQGHFSSVAMLALKCNNFIAAVNTEMLPMPGAGDEKPTVADFLDVATTRYNGFALFRRRYPEAVAEFPLQLFVGKPLLIVEHHAFFKDGFDRVSAMVESIKKITPEVRWSNLSEILLRSYKLRKVSADETHCQLFASSQVLENRESTEQEFVVMKHEPKAELVKQILVDGKRVEYARTEDGVQFTIRVPAGGSVGVQFEYHNPLPCPPRKLSAKQRTKIGVRRYLSEFRDNVIARNESLLSAATTIKNILSS
jgi:hypothetical protein